ncbi:hypothetical protein BGZ80_009233, partial [Entomortierella chlamydospora]
MSSLVGTGPSDPLMEPVVVPTIDSLIPTFRFMVHRKLRRRAHGIGAQKLELATSWPELALIVILLLVMIYVVVKVSIIIRWCFYWLVLATLVLFAINRGSIFDQFLGAASGDTDPDGKMALRAKIVLIVLASLELLTL